LAARYAQLVEPLEVQEVERAEQDDDGGDGDEGHGVAPSDKSVSALSAAGPCGKLVVRAAANSGHSKAFRESVFPTYRRSLK
jgi:hypothetical protein